MKYFIINQINQLNYLSQIQQRLYNHCRFGNIITCRWKKYQYFAGLQYGHEPTEEELIAQYFNNGGREDFARRYKSRLDLWLKTRQSR